MNDASGVQQKFRLEEATIDDLHRAIQAGETTVVDVVKRYIERVRAFNGVASMLVTDERRRRCTGERDGARRRVAAVPDPDREGLDDPSELDKYQGPPIEYGRMEATASDPSVQQQFGMIVGIAERRPGQRHRHAEHPRRALGHLQGRVRQASIARSAAARRAAGLRILPPAARCAGARRRARRAIRPQSRSQENADVRRGVLVQGPVRHQGHALDRRRRRPLRHGLPGARPRAGRAAPQQGRDHLRQGGEHRIQRPRRRSGRPQSARQGAALDARLSAQHLGRQSVEPLRHHALGLARLELRLGAVGQRQHGDGEPGRRDARVLPRPVEPQRGGADPAAQVDDRLRWRRDRRRHLLRPHRHPCAQDPGLRENPRCAEGRRRGLLRSARRVLDGAALVGAELVLRDAREDARRAECARRRAARRDPRVDGLSEGLQDRAADRRCGRRRRSRTCSAAGSARRWWNRPIRCGSAIRTWSR